MKTAYLSLGSNVGDRRGSIEEALGAVADARLHVTRRSSWYETEPRGMRDQPWFLNIAVEIETSLLPMMLLDRIAQTERAMGRRRGVRNGPRIIDIDIILYGQFVVRTPRLTIPHERMHERRFVLEPLAELIPDVSHPLLRRSIRELLQGVADQPVRKVLS